MTTGRICLECVHCWVFPGHHAYGEYTPSTPFVFRCMSGHQFKTDIGDHVGSKETLLDDLQKAETCPDFRLEVRK